MNPPCAATAGLIRSFKSSVTRSLISVSLGSFVFKSLATSGLPEAMALRMAAPTSFPAKAA